MEPAHLLFICTANQCRSPMAEALVRARLAKAGLGDQVAVSSAGLLPGGSAATSEAIQAVEELGADLGPHRSQPLQGDLIDSADVVIGLAREHSREAVVLRPDAIGRVFTFKELVRRAQAAGPRRPGDSLDDYIARLGAGRNPADLLGRSRDDDVSDPIGRPVEVYRKTAAQLDDLVSRLVAHLWPHA
jgi:protein-tyrosine phosphatase